MIVPRQGIGTGIRNAAGADADAGEVPLTEAEIVKKGRAEKVPCAAPCAAHHAPPAYGPVVTRCGAARPQAQRRLRDERKEAEEEAARLKLAPVRASDRSVTKLSAVRASSVLQGAGRKAMLLARMGMMVRPACARGVCDCSHPLKTR